MNKQSREYKLLKKKLLDIICNTIIYDFDCDEWGHPYAMRMEESDEVVMKIIKEVEQWKS